MSRPRGPAAGLVLSWSDEDSRTRAVLRGGERGRGRRGRAPGGPEEEPVHRRGLLDWLKLLVAEDIPLEALQSKDDKVAVPPLVGALLKNEQDVTLFEKLVFMQRNNR